MWQARLRVVRKLTAHPCMATLLPRMPDRSLLRTRLALDYGLSSSCMVFRTMYVRAIHGERYKLSVTLSTRNWLVACENVLPFSILPR